MIDEKLLGVIEIAHAFARENINLAGCYYGKPHWKAAFVDTPHEYYYFLAGLVALLPCSRVFEIGTHFGGSIFSMARGIEHAGLLQSAQVVTIDIRDCNSEAFQQSRTVRRILGDCLDSQIAQAVQQHFASPVDLMFLDATHNYRETKRCLDLYVPMLLPRIVILDDIRLNDSMRQLWSDLSGAYGPLALDITECSHREKQAGFGLLISDRVLAGSLNQDAS